MIDIITKELDNIGKQIREEVDLQIIKVISKIIGFSVEELEEMSPTDIAANQLKDRILLKNHMGYQKTTVVIDGMDIAEVSITYDGPRITISTEWLLLKEDSLTSKPIVYSSDYGRD